MIVDLRRKTKLNIGKQVKTLRIAKGVTQEELAEAGIKALEEFIREMGLPHTFTEMGITDKSILKKVAGTCNLTAGCCKKLSREEILEILEECF